MKLIILFQEEINSDNFLEFTNLVNQRDSFKKLIKQNVIEIISY